MSCLDETSQLLKKDLAQWIKFVQQKRQYVSSFVNIYCEDLLTVRFLVSLLQHSDMSLEPSRPHKISCYDYNLPSDPLNPSWPVACIFLFLKANFPYLITYLCHHMYTDNFILSLCFNDINFLRNVQLILAPPVWKSQGWSAAYFSSPSSQLYFKCQRWQYSSVSFVVQIKELSLHLKLHDSVYFFWLLSSAKKMKAKLFHCLL